MLLLEPLETSLQDCPAEWTEPHVAPRRSRPFFCDGLLPSLQRQCPTSSSGMQAVTSCRSRQNIVTCHRGKLSHTTKERTARRLGSTVERVTQRSSTRSRRKTKCPCLFETELAKRTCATWSQGKSQTLLLRALDNPLRLLRRVRLQTHLL